MLDMAIDKQIGKVVVFYKLALLTKLSTLEELYIADCKHKVAEALNVHSSLEGA